MVWDRELCGEDDGAASVGRPSPVKDSYVEPRTRTRFGLTCPSTRELEISFPVLLNDPGPAPGVSQPSALPTTLVLAPDGSLARDLVGPQCRES